MLAPELMRGFVPLVSALVVFLGVSPANGQAESLAAASPDREVASDSAHELLDRPAMVVLKNASVADALHRLNESSGVNVAFSRSLAAKVQRQVSCDCSTASVREALEEILRGTPLDYASIRGQIVVFMSTSLRRSPFMVGTTLAMNSASSSRFVSGTLPRASAGGPSGRSNRTGSRPADAEHEVRGTVTSTNLQPLSGVMVSVQGSTIGTITDVNGTYSLVAPGPEDTLVFSFLGHGTVEEPIDGRSVVDVVMQPQALSLEGVVVVGYGEQSRAVISGSVSSADAEEISRTSATTSANALVGKIQGINTRQPSSTMPTSSRQARDGRPGSATTLQIRNMGEPLFVIDGVPVDAQEFNHLNAADIENISILKDASASVYGFRASNGVVLVTTKGGDRNQPARLRVDGYYGMQRLHRTALPHGFGNTAYQHQYAIVESEQNLGQQRSMDRDELQSWLSAPTFEHFPLTINNQNAPQLNLNTSLTGGTADATYYLSVGHLTQDYVMKDNNFSRTNVQANVRANVFDGLELGSELRGRLEAHETVASGASSDPVQGIFRATIASWPHEDPWANGNRDYVHGDVRYLIRSPAVMSRAIGGTRDQYIRSVTGNFWAEYTLPFGAQARGTFSRSYLAEQYDYHGYDIPAYCYDGSADSYNVCDVVNAAERQHARQLEQDEFIQLQLSHDGQIGGHSMSGVVAYEQSGGEVRETEVRSVPPSQYSHLIDIVDINGFQNEWGIERRSSFIGRLNYDYEQKYLLEALGRYDGSYLYAEERRWGFFPGFSAGWRLTEEPFLQTALGFFDEFKLRASWGQAGREVGMLPWDFLGGATYGAGVGNVMDGALVPGVRPRGLPVTNLSWVTSTTRNFGVDFAFLGQRVSGEIDVFERKLTGLPASRYDVLLPVEVGYALPNENLESEANRGIEGIVRYTSQVGEVAYTVQANGTLSRNKVLERYKPRYGNSLDRYFNGTENRWAGTRFDYQVVGQFQSMEEIANHQVDHDGQGNRTLLPGDYIFNDVNGDGIINSLDQRPIGWGARQTPIVSFGAGTTLSYRGFNLAVDVAGAHGRTYQPMNDVRLTYNTGHASGAYHQSRWRRADPYDDNSEWIPGRYPPLRQFATNHSSNRTSDRNVLNVTYLRVNRVELGYSVPEAFSDRVGLSQVRLYASASNPWWIDNNRPWSMDPEATVANVYPPTSVNNFGFSATLGGRQTDVAPIGPPPVSENN